MYCYIPGLHELMSCIPWQSMYTGGFWPVPAPKTRSASASLTEGMPNQSRSSLTEWLVRATQTWCWKSYIIDSLTSVFWYGQLSTPVFHEVSSCRGVEFNHFVDHGGLNSIGSIQDAIPLVDMYGVWKERNSCGHTMFHPGQVCWISLIWNNNHQQI